MDQKKSRSFKNFFNSKNQSAIVKLTNIALFLSMASASQAGGFWSYLSFILCAIWLAFHVLFFGLKKRYITCLVFVSLLIGYFYLVFRFSGLFR